MTNFRCTLSGAREANSTDERRWPRSSAMFWSFWNVPIHRYFNWRKRVLEIRRKLQMYRVKIDTVSSLEFGPLFDGALVGEAELAEAVRLTAVSFDFSIIKQHFVQKIQRWRKISEYSFFSRSQCCDLQLNASRAYRLSSDESMRPLQHREAVFWKETISQAQAVPLSSAIHSLFIPCM